MRKIGVIGAVVPMALFTACTGTKTDFYAVTESDSTTENLDEVSKASTSEDGEYNVIDEEDMDIELDDDSVTVTFEDESSSSGTSMNSPGSNNNNNNNKTGSSSTGSSSNTGVSSGSASSSKRWLVDTIAWDETVTVKDTWTETINPPEEGHWEVVHHPEKGHWDCLSCVQYNGL